MVGQVYFDYPNGQVIRYRSISNIAFTCSLSVTKSPDHYNIAGVSSITCF